jgi:small subunit ribosomal protein S6
MKEYEALFIIDPLRESSLKEVIGNIHDVVNKAKGSVSKEENWGKKRLPYEIKKNQEGIYYRIVFSADPLEISSLKNNYKLNSSILRSTITVK